MKFKNLELEKRKPVSKATQRQAPRQGPPPQLLHSLRSSQPQLRPRGQPRWSRPRPQRWEPPRKPPRGRRESPRRQPRQPGVRYQPLRWVCEGIGKVKKATGQVYVVDKELGTGYCMEGCTYRKEGLARSPAYCFLSRDSHRYECKRDVQRTVRGIH